MVERITGTPKDKFLKVCELIASTATGDRTMTSMYALGWTQHTTGSQNIRCMAMIQLLLGNMGMIGGGVNALRGHANVQGITDLALLSTSTPGYLVLPTDGEATYADYMKSARVRPASGRTTRSSSSASRRPSSAHRRRRTTTGPTSTCPSSPPDTTPSRSSTPWRPAR
jgi:anaerobic selenocysteine-containing dehydrogenase